MPKPVIRRTWFFCTILILFPDFFDFEDEVQYYAAKREQADYILSRDESGFKVSDIPVMNVTEFLNVFIG